MTQLDPEDYLDAYRATQADDDATLDAVYARLQAQLGPGSGPLGGGGASALHGGALKVLVGLAAAAGLGLVFLGRPTPSPKAEPSVAAVPDVIDVEGPASPASRAQSPLETKPVVAQPPDVQAEDSTPTMPSTRTSSAVQPRSQSERSRPETAPAKVGDEADEASDLAEDLRCIKRIRADVIAARYDEALAGIEQHRIEYPNSPFGKERTVLELEARCSRDGAASGQAEARRFLDKNLASSMAERVRVACELSE